MISQLGTKPVLKLSPSSFSSFSALLQSLSCYNRFRLSPKFSFSRIVMKWAAQLKEGDQYYVLLVLLHSHTMHSSSSVSVFKLFWSVNCQNMFCFLLSELSIWQVVIWHLWNYEYYHTDNHLCVCGWDKPPTPVTWRTAAAWDLCSTSVLPSWPPDKKTTQTLQMGITVGLSDFICVS